MKRIIATALATAALAGTALAYDYDRLLEAIHLPNGAYFNTGCVVTDNPRVIADVSFESKDTIDLFAVGVRSAGCWILDCENGRFYYRYGTQSHGGATGTYKPWQRMLIECGESLIVNGTTVQTAAAFDFSANESAMTIPGTAYLNALTIRSFKIEDGGQLVRDFVPATKDGECGLYDRVNDQFYANAGTGTVTEEVNLLSYSVRDGSGNLITYSDGHAVWATGREADKHFDGSVAGNDFYDPKQIQADTWTGYEVSTTCRLTRVRYYGRTGLGASVLASHMGVSAVEGANSSDFSDAVVLMTFNPPADYNGGSWVEEPVSASTQAFRYFRIIEHYGTFNSAAGAVKEIEFIGVDADSFGGYLADNMQPPTDLAATRGAYPRVANTLTWRLAAGSSETAILRATGANGPWTEIARVSGNVFHDVTATAGIRSYYRVAANYSINGETVSLTNDTAASAFRWRLLERDPEISMTQFRSGVSLIYKGGPTYWTGSSLENSCMRAFNNAVHTSSSNADHADIKAVSPRTCIGVDLGQPAHFALMRFFPRNNNGNCNGVVLSGSNNSSWDTNFAVLTDPISGVVGDYYATWMERPSLYTETTYRYLFCHNPTKNDWNDNVSELQLYGWTESDIASVAQGVTDLAATCGTTPSVTLAWTPTSYGTYTIERKTDDGAWTVVASALSAATATWTDTGVVCDGTLHTYRVTTVNGASEAISEECEVRPYLAGNGTGLHAEWWTNYVTTTGGEMLALVTTNATIDFADASVGTETENLLARWSGKLIAPLAGDFTFEAEAEDVAYLWIDGVAVLYKGKANATQTLTAGEHDVTAMWYHKTGSGSCRILWGGCVTHEVIPSTQLIPVPPRTIPGEWAGARAFDASADSLFLADVKANADGSLDMAHSGRDLSWGTIGYNFLWKPVKGDFTLVAKVDCLPPTGDRWYGRKAGLMVRSSLDAAAMMRTYGIKRTGDNFFVDGRHKTTATGQYVREHDKVAGAPIGSYPAPASSWVRLRRRGNVFTAHYKCGQMANWALEYEYEDVNGEYGETTYVGLSAWGEGDGTYTTVPCYLWRFSEVSLTTPRGFIMVVR